jgi:hypothetical protein
MRISITERPLYPWETFSCPTGCTGLSLRSLAHRRKSVRGTESIEQIAKQTNLIRKLVVSASNCLLQKVFLLDQIPTKKTKEKSERTKNTKL